MPTTDNVVASARKWIGREFKPGQTAQCANFVRHVFANAGINLPSAAKPSDLSVWPQMPLASSYANSLAGDEIGPKVSRRDVRKGDILLWRDTYSGDFPAGCITHVGIATSNDMMIDRSTSSAPVRERSIDGTFPGLFFEARRPKAYNVRTLSYAANKLTIDSAPNASPVELRVSNGKTAHLIVNGRERRLTRLRIEAEFEGD